LQKYHTTVPIASKRTEARRIKSVRHTSPKDRQSQVKIVFALIGILCNNDWLTRDQIIEKLSAKGYERGDKTVKRLLSMLKELNFNLMTDRKKTPYRYKANRKRPFV